MKFLCSLALVHLLYWAVYIGFKVIEQPQLWNLWSWGGMALTLGTTVLVWRRFRFWLAIMALLPGLLLQHFVVLLQPGYVFSGAESLSNYPSIQPQDFVIGRKGALNFGRGDMVSFRDHQNNEKLLRKRIHGVPGDRVHVCNGVVYINNYLFSLKNNWQPVRYQPTHACEVNQQLFRLAAGEYFVLGDNPDESRDSRHFGPIRIEQMRHVGLYAIHADSPVFGPLHVTDLRQQFLLPTAATPTGDQ